MARIAFSIAFAVLLIGTPGCRVTSTRRGISAAEHGCTCGVMLAAKAMTTDMYRSDALEPIAERKDLTTHEQMHLVDIVIDEFSTDMYRVEVLVRLARNPALTPEGRAYLVENLKGMSTDMYRSDVVEALQEGHQGRPQ